MMDSLPYVDEPNEDYEQYALALIEEEMKRLKAPPLSPIPAVKVRNAPFLPEQLANRDENGHWINNNKESTAAWSSNDHHIAAVQRPPPEQADNIAAWQASVQRARIAYETERIRGMVLSADKEESSAAWKRHHDRLAATLQLMEQGLAKESERIEVLNHHRQSDQQEKGRQLQVLTAQNQSLLDKQVQLRRAIAELKQSIRTMTTES